jgi:L-ascorbate metabolism protein UlaG (beta-lactamase superfamily)
MKKLTLAFIVSFAIFVGCGESSSEKKKSETDKETADVVKITPIEHATTVLEFEGKTIYLDPTGGAEAFANFKKPDLVFITDIHGDHMNLKTLNALDLSNTTMVVPAAVAEKLGNINSKEVIIINNGETKKMDFFSVEAIPMYNLREEALKFHPKGRGNGYVLNMNGERIYFSGDTEDIPEMRNLKNIDRAFVCMNLPYTMTVESAASAVLDFQPKKVYPYHYRGSNGKSDVVKFQQLVQEGNKNIEVVQWNWY